MRACARVALVLMAVSASFGLAGCAAIDELKEAFLRWVESEKLPSGRGFFADDLPAATPVIPPKKPSKKEASKPSKQVKSQRANCNGCRPLCFLQRNLRSRIPPRRRGRKAPRGNLRRLSLRRRGCLVAGPKHRPLDVFHAKIGNRLAIPVRPLDDWLKLKNPVVPAVKREAEEDWGR
jgi:hypothetical protein